MKTKDARRQTKAPGPAPAGRTPAPSVAQLSSFSSRLRAALRQAQGKLLRQAQGKLWSLVVRNRLDDTLRDFLADRVDGSHRSDDWMLISENLAPNDIPWSTRQTNLLDAFTAWRTNPLARRIVGLTTDYVIGDGLSVDSQRRDVARFVTAFWQHRQNRMAQRLPLMLDEQTRAGELFVVLHRNPVDGMSFLRHIPASSVPAVRWREGDYEQLTHILEQPANGPAGHQGLDLIPWPVYQPDNPDATRDAPAVVLHFPINRPVGATRGEGDLDPILYWLQQYSAWLDGRATLNRVKSSFYYDVTIDGTPEEVNDAKARYKAPPSAGTVVVHSAAETHQVQKPQIGADDAEADGRALRLMVASGAHIPIHFLSEVMSGTTLGSSVQMNEPTFRHYAARQALVADMVQTILAVAYRRAVEIGKVQNHDDLKLSLTFPEIQRDDNKQLAEAAKQIAEAFAAMKSNALDTDPRLVRIIYKFAGELLTDDEIAQVVRRARAEQRRRRPAEPQPTDQEAPDDRNRDQ